MSKIIPYDLSIRLKNLGFDDFCNTWWYLQMSEKISLENGYNKNSERWLDGNHCSAPNYDDAIDWIENKSNYELVIERENDVYGWKWTIYSILETRKSFYMDGHDFSSKTEARINCIDSVLKSIENKITNS